MKNLTKMLNLNDLYTAPVFKSWITTDDFELKIPRSVRALCTYKVPLLIDENRGTIMRTNDVVLCDADNFNLIFTLSAQQFLEYYIPYDEGGILMQEDMRMIQDDNNFEQNAQLSKKQISDNFHIEYVNGVFKVSLVNNNRLIDRIKYAWLLLIGKRWEFNVDTTEAQVLSSIIQDKLRQN